MIDTTSYQYNTIRSQYNMMNIKQYMVKGNDTLLSFNRSSKYQSYYDMIYTYKLNETNIRVKAMYDELSSMIVVCNNAHAYYIQYKHDVSKSTQNLTDTYNYVEYLCNVLVRLTLIGHKYNKIIRNCGIINQLLRDLILTTEELKSLIDLNYLL